MINELSPWQVKDEDGTVLPYYTQEFLNELKTWDLKEKKIWEYGMGYSTFWFFARCKELFGAEDDIQWYSWIINHFKNRIDNPDRRFIFEPNKYGFVKSIFIHAPYDIVIVDSNRWKDECTIEAVKCINDGGLLIYDNWLQESVTIASDEVQELLEPFECKIFKQSGHDDWQTATFKITK